MVLSGAVAGSLTIAPTAVGAAATLNGKVHIFWEGHKNLRNLPLTFDQ